MSRNWHYSRKTERLNRSVDVHEEAPQGNPWQLLAGAILLQAAIDCSNWRPELELEATIDVRADIRYRRFAKLREFINSDWIDMLLCWQHQITPDGYCEELVRRLTS